jgi:hypothetical protein
VAGHLDDALFERLSGGGVSARPDEAILVATTDERGRAHPALLAYGEVLAISPSIVRLAVSGGGMTARNLRDRGALTICLVDAGGAAYVKAAARPLPPEPSLVRMGMAAFEATVEDVLVDSPARGEEARLRSGITFIAADPARRARDSAAGLEALRRA